MLAKISLKTDFKDYYDHVFYGCKDIGIDRQFVRLADDSNSSPKSEQLQHLNLFGFKVPKHGFVADIISPSEDLIVVYTDELKHRGEGKFLLSSLQASKYLPDKYASEYIDFKKGESYRLLQVGTRSFWYEYKSATDWRSNCGAVEISQPVEIINWGQDHTLMKSRPALLNPYPIFAIDFIDSVDGKVAVDLNTAAGMRWTGMEKLMSPMAVYKEVAEFMELT